MNAYIDVFERYHADVENLRMFVSLCEEGLHMGTAIKDIEELLGRYATTLTQGSRQQIDQVEEFAKTQVIGGLPFLYELAVMKLWTILESYVDDILSQRLLDPGLPHNPALDKASEKLRLSFEELMKASNEDRIEILIERLKENIGAPKKKGCGRFEDLLEAVSLRGGVHPTVRRLLFELSEVRNVIAHRNATADKRFREACPSFLVGDAKRVNVARAHYRRYSSACLWYIMEIGTRVNVFEDSDHPELKLTRAQRFEDIKEIYIKHIEQSNACDNPGKSA